MRIAILELPATWGDPGAALDEVDRRLASGPPAELVLLPEASLHGYVSPDGDFDVTPFAEALDGPTATRCRALARRHATHLVAPLVLREGATISNAMIAYAPDSDDPAFVYRKRHPWFPETWATPGRAPLPVVAIAGVPTAIAICYDLHFLVAESAAELTAARLLLFPSAWVEEPDHRAARLQRLAQRFELVIANANWAPGIVRVPGQGGSCIVAPDGAIVARAPHAGRIDHVIAYSDGAGR